MSESTESIGLIKTFINPNVSRETLLHDLKVKRLQLLIEKKRRIEENKLSYMFPSGGRFARKHYQKHINFFTCGQLHMIRLLMGGNRVGKTDSAMYESVLHMTGLYPDWWQGRRFYRTTKGWIVAVDFKVLVETIQPKLFGEAGENGFKFNGLIPRVMIGNIAKHSGMRGAIESFSVNHVAGGRSQITFKTYEQSIDTFQSAKLDWASLDEEPPLAVAIELVMRLTNTTGTGKNGILMITFTPLKGLSSTILHFLPSGDPQDRQGAKAHITQIEWDDCPHLSDEVKKELVANLPVHEREARMRGIPAVGEGAIYPFAESSYVVDPFELPNHWARGYGFDTSNGISPCGGAWGALDKDSDILYIYSDYCRISPSIAEHVDAIKARGDWLTGAFDYAGVRSSETEVVKIIELYRRYGLNIVNADKSVFMGINKVYERFATGRLKIFTTCKDLIREMRLYRYDDQGQPVKQNDHVLDSLRYLITTGLTHAMSEVQATAKYEWDSGYGYRNDGRSAYTGY